MVRSKLKKIQKKVTWPIYAALVALCLIGVGLTQLATARADSLQAADAVGSVQSIWPSNNANVSGTTTFLASVNGVSGSKYDMFWYVDNGTWNWMGASPTTTDLKQADVDLSGWHWHSDNTYTISFVAVMHESGARSHTSVTIHIDSSISQADVAAAQASAQAAAVKAAAIQSATQTAVTAQQQVSASTPVIAATPTALPLFVDPNNVVNQNLPNVSDSTARRILLRLAQQPMANWYGNWNSNVTADVANYVNAAAAANQQPVLVAYNIPQRDCGGYSAGGSDSDASYLAWMQNFANGIGSKSAMVLLEPDALAQMDCLSSTDQANRLSLLNTSVNILKANPRTKVYIDAGNPGWISAGDMANRLKKANIAAADGFSLNVSNYVATSDNLTYGKQIADGTGGKHFVIDTGRNGNGAGNDWCNPSGRALGPTPTVNTGNALADAYLWVKAPGGSDGQCNGGGDAGSWSVTFAVELAQAAGW